MTFGLANRDICFAFDELSFSYSNVMTFCNLFLRFKFPTLINYTDNHYYKSLSVMDDWRDGVHIELRFDQMKSKKSDYFVTIVLDNKKDSIFLDEVISLNTYKKYLSYAKYGMPVYLYVMTKDFDVIRYTTKYGVRGVEGVVNKNIDFDSDWLYANNVEWLRINRHLRDSIAHVWFYELETQKAIDMLQECSKKQRRKYLKKQYKAGKYTKVRYSQTVPSNQLKQLFYYVGGNKNTVGRICRVLSRYKIDTIERLRQNLFSVEEFSNCRGVGNKLCDIYEKAYELIIRQQKLHTS